MIYEVDAKLLFTTKAAADAAYTAVRKALVDTTTIHPGQDNSEYSYIQLLLSNHELDPPKPSKLLKSKFGDSPSP